MVSETLIEVTQLSRYFSGVPQHLSHMGSAVQGQIIAVDEISFTLQRGEILGFLGPNGAGKSTTMQMLTGNLSPTHGSIKIGGIDLMDHPIEAKAMIGYLPDTPPLYKELSVDEYLTYCAQLNRVPRNHIRQALNSVKEHCGLTEHGRRVINNLSKGYQQRVGIAQAIIHSPDIVILDEPTVGLDPIQMIEIRKLIKELGKSHSVMLSSHILPEVQNICDSVQIINQGKLIFSSSVDQLNQHMQTHSLRLSCTQTIDLDLLKALKNIHSVEQDGQTLTIHCSDQTSAISISQELITLATQNHWGLYEIYPLKRTLEEVFMSLTQTEVSPHKADLQAQEQPLD